ncbi:MAG: Rieske 2Fe-2S domain-containing protein [Planctomycetota bacterium]
MVEFEISIDEALALDVGQVATNDDDLIAVCIGHRVTGAIAIHEDKYLIAFSTICTHMGCHLAQVRHEPEDGVSTDSLTLGPCACHGTLFDLLKSGLVVLGPATQNLPQLRLMRDDTKIYADGWVLRGGAEQTPPTEDAWPCSDDDAEEADGGQ